MVQFSTKGFSLVEVLLASFLFGFLVTVFVGAYIYGQDSTTLAGRRARATFLAQEALEAVRSIRDDNFSNLVDGTYGLAISGNQWIFSGSSDSTEIFTRQVTISTVDADRKQITAQITWQQNPQRTGNISLTTYLTDWAQETINCDIDAAGTYIEAENFTGTIVQGTATFVEETSVAGYNGAGYLRSNGGNTSNPPTQEGKQYLVTFTTPGVYNVWIRGYGPNNGSDSIWVGLSGVSVGALTEGPSGSWEWTNTIQTGLNTITISTAGNYYFNIWIRESGHLIDGIYLTTGIETPTGGIPSGVTVVDPTACTLTPPIDSCNAYCQGQGYVSGSCRADSIQCTNNGEIYGSGGDPYCTGGASADTCCCLPGSDIVPPSAITDLALSNATDSTIDLAWTAPGDDGGVGTATSYDIRYSTSPITEGNWASAIQVTGEPTPSIAGSNESMTVTGLSPTTLYYFAIKTSDEIPNISAISNVPSLSTIATIIFFETFPNADAAWNGSTDTAQDEPSWVTYQGNGDNNDVQVSNEDIGSSPSGGNHLTFEDADQGFQNPEIYDIAYVPIDLSTYTGITIEYYWQSDDVDNGEGMRVAYSTDSTNGTDGNWTQMAEYLNPTDDVWNLATYSLPDIDAVSTFMLRFSSNSNRTNEHMYVDDIKIYGTAN